MLANINVGVITVIWCLKTPGVALTEYFFFGTKLKKNYKIGIGMLMISAVALSISQLFTDFSSKANTDTLITTSPDPLTS